MTSNGKQYTNRPLLHVIRGSPMLESQHVFQNLLVLFCYITNNLMTGPLGNTEFCFPRISMFTDTISMISLISSLPLKLYLNSLWYARNIFGSSSKVFSNLRKSSEIFGNWGTFVCPLEQFRKIFGNLLKVVGKRRHQYFYVIKGTLHGGEKI